jgi:golgin subfamily B member 1
MADVEFPETLFERVRTGNCILCTGVRFASAAGMPAWDTLFTKMSSKLGGGDDGTLEKLISEGKFLTVAGYLKRKLGAESCAAVLQESYGTTVDLPETHQLLSGIPFRAALTTGYDTLVERTVTHNGNAPKVYTYADGAVLRLADDLRDFILKAHGDVAHSTPLVVDRLDYKRVIGPNQAYRSFVEDLYRTHTLLIVGYHISDPDFVLFLERLVASFRDSVTDHYAILPGVSQPEQEELYANYRVRVIPYDEGSDPVGALAAVLKHLRDQWNERGGAPLAADDPAQRVTWLRQQLVPVEVRLDVMATEGLELSDGRLDAIRKAASKIELLDLDAETLCRLGNVYSYFGDSTKACECYNAALAVQPKMAEAHLNLHHASAEEKKFDEALQHLKTATELDPSLRTIPSRYEITAVIGRGTTGTIYQARDTQQNRDVTVKVLRASYVREHVSPERWLKETEELKKLEHPNLAKVYEALLEGRRCILVTESLSGRSLSGLLRTEGHLQVERAVQILAQVCKGLQHAHAEKIAHLDVTPSNIFLRDDSSAALMDFRTGRAQRGRFVTEKGAEGYLAPELIAGAGGDARSDIYSLGAVLYTLLSGKVPLGSFSRLAEVNPAARRYDPLVTRSMRAVPEERPPSVEEFVRLLTTSSEEVVLPERDDDLEGWIEVLSFQPDHAKARENLSKLEVGFRERKEWEPLITLLLGRVEFEAELEVREKTLREVAQIFEREVGDLGKAFAALQAAFRENNSSVEIRKELERLAGATGMWNELMQEYTMLVQNLRDPKVACDWWVRMGHLYSNELGHDDYAQASFNQALTLDSNRRDALGELAEVLKRKGLNKEYARVLSRLADLEDDAAKRIDLLKDLARTYVKDLQSDEEAIAAYRKILDTDPSTTAAVAALEGLYRKHEMWDELAQLLRARVEITELADDLRAYRHSLADLYSDKLKRPVDAIEQYEQLLKADADDTKALKSLERLYDATGRNEDYVKILDKRIAAADSVDEKVALCRRMAAEWEAQEGGKPKAAEYLEKITQLKGGDEETFKSLSRLYWASKEWPKLIDVYNRHIKITQHPGDRAGLYAALGKIYEDHLQDAAKATEAFNNLRSVEADSKIALTALARLYQKAGVWGQAVQILQELATREESVDKQVDDFYRIGMMQHDHLKKDDEAEASFAKALELKDNHIESLLALGDLYRARRDFGKASRMLRDAARHTTNTLEKVKRLYTAATTCQDDLGNEEKALEVYEELIAVDPEHVPTGERLVALYEKAKRIDKAEAMQEMLVRKADTRERGKLIELNAHFGGLALACGHEDKALTAFRAAYDLDPTSQPVLQQLASLLYKRGENEEAGKLFQALLVHRRDAMKPAEIVDVFYKLGDIKEKMGEKPKALNMFEKALDLEPTATQVLEHAIRLYEEKGDFEAVLRCKKNILKNATDEALKLRVAEEIGDLLHEQLKRPNEALTHYRLAIELKPDLRRVLNKIMEVFIEQRRWDDAITAMGKIEDYETDPHHRARLHYTAAVIFRDELKRPDDAAWHLDQALMKDPTHRKAFDALKDLYTHQRNWKGLVKAYRLMLQRLPENEPREEQCRLWHELGEICQDKLQDARGAIVAFEVAAKLGPTDEALQDNLALLYTAAGPDAYDKAVMAHQRLLRNNPMRLEAYKELRRLYGEMGKRDEEWCVAAVLSLLKKGDEQETALYHQHRNEKPRRVARKLSDDLWRDHLYHPLQDRTLTEVFATVSPVVAPMAVRPRKSLALKSTEQLDPANDTRAWATSAAYISQVLDHHVAEMHVRGEMKEPVTMLLTGSAEEMATLLWVNPSIVQSEAEGELHYWFTKALALLRPEYFLAFATPSPTVLRAVVLACLKIAKPDTRLSGDVGEVLRLAEALKAALPPARFDALAERANELRALAGEGKTEEWMRGLELTTTRAGLVLCDDLETAARLIAVEPSGIDARERVRELMVFAVSESYFKLRELLGLKLK